MSKKLEEKRARRLADEQRRREQHRAARNRNLITIGVAVAVGALVVGAIIFQRGQDDAASNEPIGVPASEAGCTDVEEFEPAGRDHIQEGQPHADYNSDPPTSGPHFGTPADVGFYPAPLPPEQLIHNLEHGQIVIWFDPSASDQTKDGIEEYVDRENAAQDAEGLQPMLASPYDLEEGSYALTAWTRLQICERFSSAAVDDFRSQFQGEGPEPLTPPFAPDEDGG